MNLKAIKYNVGVILLIVLFSCSSVNVKDNSPQITFINLINNDNIEGTYIISVNVIDDDGIELVELYVDDNVVDQISVSPYNFTFNCNNVLDGNHIFLIKAYDEAGNIGISNPVIVNTVYDFSQNSNGKIEVSLSDYHELDNFDITGYGDPYFIFSIEINGNVFETYSSQVFQDSNILSGPIMHIFDIPDNTREYKLIVKIWDEDTNEDCLIDYTPGCGFWYGWTLIPLTGDFNNTYNGEDDGYPEQMDCQITLRIQTVSVHIFNSN